MAREDDAKAALFDGRDARRTGHRAADNPHPEGCLEHRYWRVGWRLAACGRCGNYPCDCEDE